MEDEEDNDKEDTKGEMKPEEIAEYQDQEEEEEEDGSDKLDGKEETAEEEKLCVIPSAFSWRHLFILFLFLFTNFYPG